MAQCRGGQNGLVVFGRLMAAAAVVAAGLGAGCANNGGADRAAEANAAAQPPWLAGGDPGLQVVAWSTDADQGTFARALVPYAEEGRTPAGLSPESMAFLAAHGLQLFEVPIAELESLRAAMGAPPRSVNNWLGQALVWTEAVAGPEQPRGQTIALDGERLRLGPGRLRLLARSWISPVPTQESASGAMMTIELLPQHDEEGRRSRTESLLAPASIAATDEGLLFTRLLLRVKVRSSESALVLVGLPSNADVRVLARSAPESAGGAEERNITDGEAGAVPGVGQVVRQPAGSAEPNVAYETGALVEPEATPSAAIGPVGPPAARIPTIGEAMLSPPVWVTPVRSARRAPADGEAREAREADPRPVQTTPRRLVAVFVPRLPERLQLLP